MNRKTLLDNAIIKAKEAENWQLVEWLRMARGSESAARWYTEKLRKLEAENVKLREWCSELLGMAESNDPEWFHWPELHAELRKLGVVVDGN